MLRLLRSIVRRLLKTKETISQARHFEPPDAHRGPAEPARTREELLKRVFRAGYECTCITTQRVPASPADLESYKVRINYLIRDIYIFLMVHNNTAEDIFGEYMAKNDGAHMYQNSRLSVADVDDAVTRVFATDPELVQTYALSRVCHFFLFGLKLNLGPMTDTITRCFDHLFKMSSEHGWYYPLELQEALFVTYECFVSDMWPPTTLTRHIYACMAEIHQVEFDDLLNTVGSDIQVMDQFYKYLFPKDLQAQRPSTIVFDDSMAFYEYLKHAEPPLLNQYGFGKFRLNANADAIEAAYKHLTNVDKLKYVTLSTSATSDEVDYVKLKIAPVFEREMILKAGFLDVHETLGRIVRDVND